MRILVVEDEQAMNSLLAKQLRAAHYSVDACFTGTDALDHLLGAEYDALVLDIMLPGVSGLEVLRRMRAKGDRTPVLLLTAKDGVEDRVTGLDAGADDYLVKPFAFDELLARLRNRGIVLSREKISHHVWNYDYEGGSNVVDVYIRYLRKKLDDGFSKKLIHTVRGVGYVLREEA